MDYLKKIIERVNRNREFYDEGTPTPLLTFEEFFEGHDVIGIDWMQSQRFTAPVKT